ncbi:MAG: succinate dehydrogenase [Chloroflexi bacterium]|nr:succinate dehydrogenase [Chloroflexota bacterium]
MKEYIKERVDMKVSIDVKRFDPEKTNENTWVQNYKMDIHPSSTVLDALIHVREEIDGTLALRCACRASICGSCGMRVNGQAKLVCKTRIEELVEEGETLSVEPMGNQPVIKDLIVDISSFFAKMTQVSPFLQPDSLPEQGEFIASNDSMEKLLTEMNCIMCGLCVSDCTILEVDDTFIGPAALAKASRFVYDPRDDKTEERLKFLNDEQGGIWDCTRCMQCVEVCPKDVSPMDRIMDLRETAIEIGAKKTHGYDHTNSFEKSVVAHGRLDESRLALESAGIFNLPRLLDLIPVGLRALIKGKLPPLFPHKAEDNKKIKDIAKKIKEME